jgi:hypothetical protein
MGFVSDLGRIAFFQAINQYCATVIQQLYGEVHCARASMHCKTVNQPTSGQAKEYERRHTDRLHRIGFFKDALPEEIQENYRWMLRQLTTTPCSFNTVPNAD